MMINGKTAWIFVPFACMIGIVVGSWGPKEELRAMKRKTANADTKTSASVQSFDSFAKMVNIPEEAKHSRRRYASDKPLFSGATNSVDATASKHASNSATNGNIIAEEQHNSSTNAPHHRPRPERLDPADLRARIAEAQELWSTRVDLARAQWISKLGLEGEAESKFDEAVNGMNDKLYASMQQMAEIVGNQQKITKELGVRMISDVTGIIAEAYDSLGAAVPEDKQGEVADLDFTDFIDPAVAEPLVQVQDKLIKGMGK